jgi:hypothetical protein
MKSGGRASREVLPLHYRIGRTTFADPFVPRRDDGKAGLGSGGGEGSKALMHKIILLATLAVLASPAAADPLLVANADGSVTLTGPIDSSPPSLLLARAPRPARNAGHARTRSEAQAELDRSFQEATAQAREAARVPRPR